MLALRMRQEDLSVLGKPGIYRIPGQPGIYSKTQKKTFYPGGGSGKYL